MENINLTKRDIALLITPILVGAVCILIWWYELHQVIGWQGEKWLRNDLRGIYVITFLIVATFLLPLVVELRMPAMWGGIYTVLLYITGITAFFVARHVFMILYTKGLIMGDERLIAYSIWKLLGIVIIVAIVFFIPMRHFHKTTDGMHVITIMVALISVVPASIICVENLPLWDSQIAFMDAVKVGYPVFWVPIFLGLLSTASAKEWV